MEKVIYVVWEQDGFDTGAVADRLTRPRLSYNVAVYHRTLNEEPA